LLRTLAIVFSSMCSYYAIMSFSPGAKVTFMDSLSLILLEFYPHLWITPRLIS
jgi:hypothetical protein